MEQKRVSFKVAKAIKEAGYPQGITPYQYVTKNYSSFKEGEIIDAFFEVWAGDNVIDVPYIFDVWLWLWREKNIRIYTRDYYGGLAILESSSNYDNYSHVDPEEAIIAAIDYLVDKDLIK